MPIGTLTQNTQCQSRPWVTAPPMSGPAATPRPEMPPHRPTAAPRRSTGIAVVTSVRPTGASTAAPSPWTARNAMSRPRVGASAQAALDAVKTASPVRKVRRRP